MPTPPQTSIRALLIVTGLVALWLTVHQVHANTSWLFLSWFLLFAATLVTGKHRLFFWLPLVACINLLILTFFPWWFPPHDLIIPVGGGIASIIAIFTFAKDKTLKLYRKLEHRDGVLLSGIGNSAVAGLFVGLMLGVPVFCLVFPMWLIGGFYDLPFAFMLCIVLPVSGAFVGAILGIGFGFVFDIMVALEFKHRPRRKNRGITM